MKVNLMRGKYTPLNSFSMDYAKTTVELGHRCIIYVKNKIIVLGE